MRTVALAAFRLLPAPVRRWVVHTGAPSFTVGAVALLRRGDGHVLMVDPRHTPGWSLPGGLLRRGEAPATAVLRELREEVGLELDPRSLPPPLAAVNPRVRRVDLVFILAADDAMVARREDEAEVRRLGWFALDQLPELSDPTVDILRAVRVL